MGLNAFAGIPQGKRTIVEEVNISLLVKIASRVQKGG
jgi:hypothetical protein